VAVAGFTGSPTVLEGRFGLFAALLDGHFDQAAITDGVDGEWSVPSIFFKPYPANHFTHAGIDAAIELRENGLAPEDVASIRLGVPGPVVRTIGEPIDLKRRPETGYQAQFSGPYTIAAALMGGRGLGLGLDDFTDDLVVEEERRILMAKVDVVEDPECTNIFPDQFPATLSVRTNGGAELTARVMANRGGPERPLSDEELAIKFRDNAKRALCESTVDLLEEAVWSLVDLPSVTPFTTPTARADLPRSEGRHGRGRGRAGAKKG
jgi:2-methylcitrate dehydratase PrpD